MIPASLLVLALSAGPEGYAAETGKAAPKARLQKLQLQLKTMKETILAGEKDCYYTYHKGQKLPLDHAKRLAACMAPVQTVLDGLLDKPDVGVEAVQQLENEISSLRMVAWNWPVLTQLPKQIMPPSFESNAGVNIRACVNEREPGGFYLTNLSPEPVAVEVRAHKDIPNLLVRWVTTNEGMGQFAGSIPHLLARVVPLIDGKYIVIPAWQSRQVFLEVHTKDFRPGTYRTKLALRAHTADAVDMDKVNRRLFPVLKKPSYFMPPPRTSDVSVEGTPKDKPEDELEDLTLDEPGQGTHLSGCDRTVKIELRVDPLVLADKARFGVYTWNQGASLNAEYLALLAEHKVNLFCVADCLPFTIEGGVLTIDKKRRTGMAEGLANIIKHGKIISLYGIVQHFTNTVKKNHDIDFMQGDYARYLEAYFRQYIGIFKEAGVDYADYTLEVWDEPTNVEIFRKMKEALDLLHKVDPKVRFMVDPMYKKLDGYKLIADHIHMWIPHNGFVYDCYTNTPLIDMVDAGFDPAEWGEEGNRAVQIFLHKQRREKGAYCMMYSQYGGKSNLCPVGYFRHWPWKMWWMRFDGITFWNAWDITNGPVEGVGNPNKGLIGWREGVKDIQYLYMLKDAIDLMKKGRAPADEITKPQAVLKKAVKLGWDWDWWCNKPMEAEPAMNKSRELVVRELLRLREKKLIPENGPGTHFYVESPDSREEKTMEGAL